MYKFFEKIIYKIRDSKPLTKGILAALVVILFYATIFSIVTTETNSNTVNIQNLLNSVTTENINLNNTTNQSVVNTTNETTPNEQTNNTTSTPSNNISSSNTSSQASTTYTVIRVVDGDTFKINYNGKEESVRLIGVDTPESVHPDAEKNTEFGKTASNFSKNYLEGKEVTLEFDVQERDQYGRLLAYVYLNGIMYNKTLLEEGYAKIATYPPNVKYVDDFTTIQEEARNNKKGLWGYETTSSASNSSQTSSATNTINSNSSSTSDNSENIEYNGQTVYKSKTGSKYHYSPTCSNMKNPTEITLEEAENLGLEPCKKCVL